MSEPTISSGLSAPEPPAEMSLVPSSEPATLPLSSVSQWIGLTVAGKPYAATVGFEQTLEGLKRVVVIYTGRPRPLYARGESFRSVGAAMTEATTLILNIEARAAALALPDGEPIPEGTDDGPA